MFLKRCKIKCLKPSTRWIELSHLRSTKVSVFSFENIRTQNRNAKNIIKMSNKIIFLTVDVKQCIFFLHILSTNLLFIFWLNSMSSVTTCCTFVTLTNFWGPLLGLSIWKQTLLPSLNNLFEFHYTEKKSQTKSIDPEKSVSDSFLKKLAKIYSSAAINFRPLYSGVSSKLVSGILNVGVTILCIMPSGIFVFTRKQRENCKKVRENRLRLYDSALQVVDTESFATRDPWVTKCLIRGWLFCSIKGFLCIRELLFTLFKVKHFSLFARKSVRKSELACRKVIQFAHVPTY